jgi:hypothetical protein
MRHVSSATLVTLVLATASSKLALAHIEMQSPTARFVQDSGGLKTAPCGSGTKTGVVTPLVAGQTLVVSWKESVSHSGHYRIAMSAHESDFVEPTSLAIPTTLPTWDLADGIPDKTGTQTYTQTVQVPSTPCTTCVLQLLQIMGAGMDGTNSGPFSGVYHACADVSISASWPDAATAPDAATDSQEPDLSGGKGDTAGAFSGAGGAGGGTGAGGALGSGGMAATGGTSASGGAASGGAASSGAASSGAASGGALSTGGTTTGGDSSNMTGGNAGTATGTHASGGAAAGAGGAAGSKAMGGALGRGGATGTTPTSGCQLGRSGSSGQSSGWPTIGLIAALFFALRLRRRRFGDVPIGAMRSPLWMSSSCATVAIHTRPQPASTRAIERCR